MASARRGLVHSARALAAAALLALVGALALPATAQAQEIVLVSNFAEGRDSTGSVRSPTYSITTSGGSIELGEQRIAQRFTAGPNTAGYVLESVTLQLSGEDNDAQGVQVAIHENNSSGDPGAQLAVLDNSADPFGGVTRTFSAPSPLSLVTGRSYWVVLSNTATTSSAFYVSITESIDQTTTQGFSIRDTHHQGTPGSWSEATDYSVRMEVRGTVVPLTLSVADASATEGSPVPFTVTLSEASTQTVTVDWTTLGLPSSLFIPTPIYTADASDYVPGAGTLTFAPGETEKTVSVQTLEDTAHEIDEPFRLLLSNPTNAVFAGEGNLVLAPLGTIVDDDEPPVVSVEGGTVGVGGDVIFTVRLSPGSGKWAYVYVRVTTVADDGAQIGSRPQSFSFYPGVTELKSARLNRVPEEAGEVNTLTFTSDPEGATVPEGTSATIRVVDATGLPAVTIAADDASVTEESGEAGFTLTRTEPLTDELTVTVELRESWYSDVLPDEMVTLQANYDQTVERTVMFAANAATAALAVTLKNDELAEGDADFTVEVKPGDGYTLGDPALATVTVTDGSDPGAVKPEHLQAIVGPGVGEVVLSWAAPLRFYEVSRHEYRYKSDGVYGNWVEIPDSGQSPDALTAAHRSGYAVTGLTGGQTHTFEVRAVNVVSGVTTASAASNEAMATPRTAALEVSFGESDYRVDEGGTVEVTVRLNGVPGREVTVPVSAAGAGGATPPGETGADWSGVPESVTFGALAAAQTFTLAATDDADAETIESVALSFGALPDGMTAGTPSEATVTIVDNETPVVTIASNADFYSEDNGAVDFTLSRAGSTAAALMVTVEVTQQEDRDLLPDGATAERTVTFAVGSATTALRVTLKNDDFRELAGNIIVEVQAGMGYTVGDPGSYSVQVIDVDTGLPTPANLMASLGAEVGEVALSWDAHAPYLIFNRHQYRYKTDGDYAEWTDIPNSGQHDTDAGDGSNLTGYTVTGLVGGQLHTFQVRTYTSSSSVSDPSDEATATPRSAAVSFGVESYSVDEGGTVAVTVQLDAAPGREVTVPVSAAGAGGATPPGETGADWSGVPENVTFGATDTAQTFTLTATDDTDVDAGESVALTFGTLPDGVTAGTPSEATVTIVDNDVAPIDVTLGADTLVSTAKQDASTTADGGSVSEWRFVAQEFTTGMYEDGYTVTGVDIVSASSSSFTAKVCDRISISADCTVLTPPDSFAVGVMSFTVPADTVLTLSKDTTNAMVVEAVQNYLPVGRYLHGWGVTDSTGEDVESAAGWSVANGYRWSTSPSTLELSLSGTNSDQTLRMVIRGAAVAGTPSTPTLSVEDAEGNEGDGVAFTVTLSEAAAAEVTATWTASIETGDTAIAADLGSTTTGPVSIAIGETATTITVPTEEDFTDEENETFTVTLSGVSASAQLATDPTATGTIVDDDAPPIVVTPSADALVSNVGQDQSTTLPGGSLAHERQVAQVFTTGTNEDGYTLTGVDIVSASSTGFTAQLCATDASGLPTSSCTGLTPPDSFAVGAMSFTPPADGTRPLTKDTTYAVVLTTPEHDTPGHGTYYSQGWSATDSTGEDTVSAAGWSIADGHLLRPSRGALSGLWGTRAGGVPLRIAIRGTAVAGTPSTPTLSVDDEMGSEDDEVVNFWAQLKDADGEVVEADADVTVTWTASFESGDTAVAADLGTTTTGTVTIEGGTGATSTMFSVMLEDDSLDEDDETFTVTLSGVSANVELVSDPTAKGTIVDNDDPPTVSVGDATATEGDPAEFTVTLSAVSGRDVTVDWATSVETGDSATSDTDFTAASDTLTIPAGNEMGTVMVATVEDTTVEDDETFTVTLSSATNAAISDATATGTITNDDAADTTCTLDTGDLWCGVVTVGTSSDGVGFVAAETETDTDVGALTDNDGDQTITIGSDSYTISSLLVRNSPVRALSIDLDESFPTDDVATLEFYIGTSAKTFKVSEATAYAIDEGYYWTDSGLTWTDGGPDVTLRLRRAALPMVTIAADRNSYAEVQGNAGFTLSRTGSTAATLTVTVEVTQQVDRDLLPDGAAAVRTVTFAVGGATAALTVALENDDLAELPGNLTVRVQAGMGYTVGAPGSATVSVADFDTGRPQPANLTASAGAGVGEVALSWDAHAPQLKFSRHQYRYKTDGNYAAWTDIPNSGQNDSLGGDGSNLTGYTVTGLVGGQLHTFQVRTYSSSSSVSDSSNEATATPRSAAVSFGAGSYSVDEGGTVAVTVQLDAAPGREVTVPVSAAGAGGATPPGETGADWSGVPENVTFGATDTEQTFTLAATDDTDVETGESVALSFGTLPDGVTAGTQALATVTIVDNDVLPTLSVANAEAAESDGVAFTVTLSEAATDDVTVTWTASIESGDSAETADFGSPLTETVRFMPSQTTVTITVPTIDDSTDEDDDTFTLTLSSPSANATLASDATATGTITDNDDPPTISVEDQTVIEGDQNPNNNADVELGFPFLVTLSEASEKRVLYKVRRVELASDTAADADLDLSGALIRGSNAIGVGATVDYAEADVIRNDDLDEPDETFTLEIYDFQNATAGAKTQSTITIQDDDDPPSVSVGDATAAEGAPVEFPVTLSAASGREVAVNWATSAETGDSAISDTDFTAASDTLTFMPGETTATVAVATIEDTLDEPDETFTLTLSSPSNATLGEATATGTITDNDDPPTLGVADAAATEGAPVEFTVTLSAAATDDVTATWTASTIEGDEEKAAAADLESTTGSVTVPKGETAATFTVATAEDALDEYNETFTVALSSPSSNATLAADATTATGTITDDDARPALIIADMSAPEESNVEFTVTLTPESGRTVTVGWGTFLNSGQTAEEEDFTSFPQNGFVTFPPGQTTAQLQVGVVDDALVESDETFEVTLGSASNARLEDNSAIGTIVDNDVAPNAAPTFTSAAMFNPAENQTAVGTVRVEDSDGDAITDYALSGGADQALFSIGSTSGVLTFQAAPNYEDPQDANTDNAYVVVVQATSGKDARVMTADQTITVTVMDDDTEAPGAPDAPSVSPASVTSLNVNWSAPDNAGPEITDYDVQYRAGTSAPWSDGSHIGTALTAILTGLLEDTEYDVQVRATNAEGTGGWSASGSGATDANAAPSFTSSATFNPAENQTAVGTVEAQDSDTTDAVTGYTLNGGADQALFSINNSGVLTFQAAPNYEDPQDANTDNAYVVVVQATSGTGDREQTGTQTITVTVRDDDTEAPGAPDAPSVSPASVTSLTVTWSAPDNAGPAITDYDVQYRAGTSAPWSDGSHIGTALTAILTGLEEDTSYQVQVRATNAEGTGGWSASGSGSTDANAAPSFTSSATFNPAENQTAVGTVAAEDNDTGDAITGYAFSGGADQALFSINNSGVLTFQAAPNYEDPQDANTDNAYLVTVQATSGTADRELTRTQTITVTVMDADEQPDTPAKPTLSAVSGSTTRLVASWTEPGLNGGPEITSYSVEYREGTTGTWIFGSLTAVVTLTITGLTEDTEHQVRVQALNGETPSAWSDASDAVRTNSAANAPVFSETDLMREVPENSAAGTNVGDRVTADAADPGDTLTYTLEGTDASLFDIVSTSGQIQTKSGVTYDYEATINSYSVTVTASTVTASDATASATVNVTINVTDEDEQPDTPAKPTLAAVSGSHTSLAARWTKPGRNGGPDITGYRVQYREGTSGWVNFTHNGAGVTRTITGLTAGTEYQVRVRAFNGETPSAFSDPSDAVSTNSSTVPGRPEVTATVGLHTSLDVSWTVPGLGGGQTISGYDVRYREGLNGAWNDWAHAGSATSTTIAGLVPNTAYQVQVRTLDGQSSSAWSRLGSGRTSAPATTEVGDLEVTGPGANGVWDRGERVEVQVKFRLPVRVQVPDGGRAPVLALAFFDNAPEEREFRSSAVAQYTVGSGTDTLTFVYTVTAADAGANHVVVVDNGLLDRDGAIRTLEGGGSETTLEQTQAGPVEVVLDGGADHAWSAGERIRVRVTFFDEVVVDTAGGTPTIGLRLGDERGLRTPVRTAAYTRGSGTKKLTFEYELRASDRTVRGVEVVANTLAANGGAIRNEQGLKARLGHPGSLWSSPQDPMRPALRVRGFDAAHEGGTLEFRVTLQPASHFEVTVKYATADGTAKAGEDDYTPASGTLTFEAGETEKTVGVEVLSDDDAEESETVRLRLSDIESDWPYGPLFSTVGEATGRIEDGAAPEDAAAPEDTGGSASGFTTGLTTVTVSVADAKVREAPGAKLEFAVTLNEVASVEVKVDYRTADGSARAGSDYTATSGTLTFRAGETEKTVSVPVLDDAHDEGNEKMLLVLDRTEGVIREDYLGIGTIQNTDLMPKAWLARFGRTASDHAVAAIEGRWRSGAEARPQTHLTIGGRRVENLFDFDRVRDSFNALEAGPAAIDPRLDPESAWARMDRLKAESLGLAVGSPAGGGLAGSGIAGNPAGGGLPGSGLAGGGLSGSDLAGGGLSGSGLLGGGPADSRSAPRGGLSAARGALAGALGLPDLRNGLMGSSFFYSKRPGDEDGPGGGTGWLGNWSAWGNTAATRFRGADGPLSLDGEVATATLGADSRWGRWHGGLALSYSEGDGVYTHPEAAGGAVTSTLTSLHPFARYEVNDRTSFWGVLGYGSGALRLTPEGAETGIETDIETAMAAFGGRGVFSVRSSRFGAFELAVVSDVRVSETVSDSVENLMGATGATSRVRVMLEGSGSMPMATGGVLKPTLEAGLRYDDGDAETGAGLEIGAGLGYAAGALAVEVKGRMLLAHEDTEYEEWGFSGSIRYQPRSDGRGLSMNLGSAWGATQSGVQSLWSRQDASGLVRGAAMNAAQRFQAELGYGFTGRRKTDALWMPFLGAESADGGAQSLRMGVRLTSGPNLEAGLEFGRLDNGRGAPERAVQLRGAFRW